jgi:photosystem II stability/assembly factor-like uncharacterized protein
VIYHDAVTGDVYVSEDEGKNWALADGVPQGQAKIILEHPFHNHYVYILTAGKTHYQTEDSGKTWRSFEMPTQPAYVPNPLSFHSDRTKYGYILYQGVVCGNDSWGSVCYQEVRDYTGCRLYSLRHRHTTQNKLSLILQLNCSLTQPSAYSRTVVTTSNTMLIPILFTALHMTHQV